MGFGYSTQIDIAGKFNDLFVIISFLFIVWYSKYPIKEKTVVIIQHVKDNIKETVHKIFKLDILAFAKNETPLKDVIEVVVRIIFLTFSRIFWDLESLFVLLFSLNLLIII